MPPEPPLRFAARSRGIPAPPAARRPRPPPPVSECVSALRRAVAAIAPGAPSAVDAAAARAYAAAAAAGEEGVALALGAPAAADRRVQAVARCAAALRTAAMDRAGYGVDLGTVGEACAWNEEAAREFDGRRDGRAPSSAAAPAGDAGGASRSGVADGGGGGAASWGAAAAVSGGAGAGGGGGSSAALDSGVSPSWLRLRCEALAVVSGGGGGGDGLTGAEMAITVLSTLQQTSRSAEEVQGELFDAFGGDFDAVGAVLSRRAAIVADADAVLADCAQAEELHAAALSGPRPSTYASSSSHGRSAAVAAAFTVTDAREVALNKQRRKDEQRAIKAGLIPAPSHGGGRGGGDADGEDSLLPKLGGSAMDELQKAFPGVALQGDTMIGGRDRVGLPAGATRTVGKGFEEVLVPSPRAAASGRPPKLVNVPEALADHPELLTAMEGVSTLNRLQSAVYPAAFRSSENLLVCAPTGAGKTNVALLTILREIAAVKRRRQADFKVVYVAPMKALAAEVVDKFGARLRPLGLRVREFTGDMSLTRKETLETHVLVTTPEKWDVVTRKGGSDLSGAVTLFIIDEIHLLHDDRGAVLESIVARTLRLSEAAQRVIRLVGLSATLPNFGDVASFMRVNAAKGLFHFDGSHRPVPLSQTFVGVTEGGTSSSMEARRRRDAKMLEIAWSKVSDALKRGHQAMIFVHSRKATGTTARSIAETASKEELQGLLLGGRAGDANAGEPVAHVLPSWAATEVAKSRTGDIRELCSKGVGIHHAGLPRTDRKLVERLFGEGAIRLLCCTATLAWGVNLPARAVVILGTDVYDAQKGAFVQLGMLDVMQIFGRAGRPQFDTEGEGTIITRHENLARYLNLLTSSIPIESTLGASASVLADHLNAEIVSGTVSSVGDGVTWLSYTYLSVRMAQNPLVYGVGWDEVAADPGLHSRRATLIEQASRALDDARMCRYDPRTGSLAPTDLGRVSSHFYVSHRTVVLWNELLAKLADGANGTTDEAWEEMDATVLHAVSCASEFEQMRARQEESDELDALARDACCVRLKASPDSREGKVNILLQSYISRAVVHLSDLSYVVQSSTRLLRALFEVALRRGLPSLTLSALELARASESRVWPFRHPLWQFCPGPGVKAGSALLQAEVVSRLESAGPAGEMQSVRDMDKEALTDLLRSPRYALSVQRAAAAVPTLAIVEASVVPITRTVLSVRVTLLPTFRWKDAIHGNAESWWLWVEDDEHERIYHSERILLAKRQVLALLQASEEADPDDPSAARGLTLDLTVPVFDPPSAQYFVRVESERWHTGGGSTAALSLHNLPLPQREPPHSELLNLRPLQVAAVLKPAYARLYTSAFTHLNPVQTQVFHAAYHTDENMLIGAPTGSGKTVMAEFAILRAFDTAPGKCVVYIAPMKALVRERMDDWRRRLSGALGKTVVELTGDAGKVDPRLVDRADVIVATPEKWDVVSRGWRRRSFVRNVSLIVLDEVHLLGADRGPVLEVIVSRARRLSLGFKQVGDGGGAPEGAPLEPDVRIVALSTALSNARELADWLGVSPSVGLFNFRPSVRPVPCEVHVIGVAGERYGPRMQAMNRPAYTSILRHSPAKPVLLFVSSRRQTRLTALDLVRLAAADGRPQRFVRDTSGGRSQITDAVARVSDDALRQALVHGVGIHHAGLADADRALAERLFADGAIQVLVSTATLAWGVNLPAHLVVVKGTEFFDAKQQRYVDMPVTDILQMMGRAGRPQFDTQAFAVILVHEPKKTFLKKFLYEPFPVESSLHKQLAPHLNAEIAAGTVASPQDAMDYLTWTYFFRRMLMNPCFYGVSRGGGPPAAEAARGPRRASQPTSGDITRACSALVRSCISRLAAAGCITVTVNAGVDSAAPNGPPSAPASGASTRLLNKDAVVDSSFAGPHGGADGILLAPTSLGQVATHYYLSIKSVALIHQRLRPGMTPEDVLSLVTLCEEFAELPVRHNEGDVNAQYAGAVAERLVAIGAFESSKEALRAAGLSSGLDVPSSKARLLLFGHMARVPPPVVDYVTDLKSVADQAGRVLQAVVDIAAEAGSLSTVQSCVRLAQMLYQARIPSKKAGCLQSLATDWTATCDAAACKAGIRTVADAVERSAELASLLTAGGVDDNVATAASKAASGTPTVRVTASLDSSAGTVSVALVPGAGRRSQQRDGRGGGREWAATSATGGRGREEGWVVLVSVKGSDRLLALKRLPRIPHSGRTCVVPLPHDRSAGPASPPPCLVTAMCDAFIGIDVTVDVSDD